MCIRDRLNTEYARILSEHGMMMSGMSPEGDLIEAFELVDHPWFVGTQYPVSYTHLDVYKRQLSERCRGMMLQG